VSRAADGVITFDPTSIAEYFVHLLVDVRKYKFHGVINAMFDKETCSNVRRRDLLSFYRTDSWRQIKATTEAMSNTSDVPS
jgi:hypothetical protein